MRTKTRQWYANQTFAMFVLPLLFGIFNGNLFPKTAPGAPKSGIQRSKFKIQTVVLDPGHGGKDPGCGGLFSHEKDNALAVALALGAQIEADFPQIKVIYTRKTDVFIPLIDRAKIANEAKADLFISIHCNSLPVRKSSIDGTEVYVLGLHAADRNLDVAMRENEAIHFEKDYQKTYSGFDPDSPEGMIFFSAWQSAYLEQSIAFASLVNDAVGETGRKARGVRQAGFMVLKETAAPSVLIETAYLTSETDENYIGSVEGQQEMAAVIFGAFSQWKSQMEGGAVAVKTQPKTASTTQPKGEISKKTVKTEPKLAQPVERPVANSPKKVVAGDGKVVGGDAKKVVGGDAKKVVGGDANNGRKADANNGRFADTKNGNNSEKPETQPVAQKLSAKPAGQVKILLTTSSKKMNPKKDPFAVVGAIEEQKINGEYRYFATGFATKTEAKKALPEIRGLGFPEAKLVD